MKRLSKTIDELTATEVFKITQERGAVFVVEQNCVYQDVDEADFQARHLCLWDENYQLQGYCRIIECESYVTFGRVLVTPNYRGQQLGRVLVTTALTEISELYPGKPVKIAAQAYLLDFYRYFGFKENSEAYLEDGIAHVDMLLRPI